MEKCVFLCETLLTIIKRDRFYDKNNHQKSFRIDKFSLLLLSKELQIKQFCATKKSIDDKNKSQAFERKLILSLSIYFQSHTCFCRDNFKEFFKTFLKMPFFCFCFCFSNLILYEKLQRAFPDFL